mgnify:FL=1
MLFLYRKVIDWGIREETPRELVLYIRMANAAFLTFFIGCCFVTCAYLTLGLNQAAFFNSIAIFAFGSSLLLMRAGYTVVARLFAVVVGSIAGYGVTIVLGPRTLIQILFMFTSVLNITYFSLQEKKSLAFALLFPLCILGFLEYTSYTPAFGLTRYPLTDLQTTLLRFSTFVSVWAMMYGHFSFFIIDRRNAQDQLISAEKMVAIGRMATSIAHEINNPLQTIVGQVERLKLKAEKGTLQPDDAITIANKVQSVAMRIASIGRGLKTLARDASRDPFSELPLDSLIMLTLEHFLSPFNVYGIKVTVQDIPSYWTVIGREAQLSQVLVNLITNAQDAVMSQKEKWIRIEATASDTFIDISVTDSGSGIPSEIVSKIFDPFFTTKPAGKGVGLGLNLSREIMAAHNGSLIYDETSPNTRFVVRVPRGRDIVVNSSKTNVREASSSTLNA